MDWIDILREESEKPYAKKLAEVLAFEYGANVCYPEPKDIFRAFKESPYNDTRVVILGQDPYHEPGQAEGLSFSVPKGAKIPPSLKNIYKELAMEYGDFVVPNHGNLVGWASQGVLLLNTALTVRKGSPASHSGYGWEEFTDACIRALDKKGTPVVFLFWGNKARAKKWLIANQSHFVLEAAHPSPFSAKNFLGCGHFKKCNEILESLGEKPINWQI